MEPNRLRSAVTVNTSMPSMVGRDRHAQQSI
jgi:hypothetical protein